MVMDGNGCCWSTREVNLWQTPLLFYYSVMSAFSPRNTLQYWVYMPGTVLAGLYSRTLMPWQISGLSERVKRKLSKQIRQVFQIKIRQKNNLRQAFSLQFVWVVVDPGQLFPHWFGAGLSHVRFLFWIPFPQVLLQGPTFTQEDHLPWTTATSRVNYIKHSS